jgi:hypothetical protein
VIALETKDATYVAVIDPDAWERGGRSSLATGDRLLVVGPAGRGAAAEAAATVFDTSTSRIDGVADPTSDRLANELRRHGIRFYSRPRDGRYQDWSEPPLRAVPDAAGTSTPT